MDYNSKHNCLATLRNGTRVVIAGPGPLSTRFVTVDHGRDGKFLLFADGRYRADGEDHYLDIVAVV